MVAIPIWLQAGFRGLLGASSLVLGAAVAYLAKLGVRVTAASMSFGCGILISAVAYGRTACCAWLAARVLPMAPGTVSVRPNAASPREP